MLNNILNVFAEYCSTRADPDVKTSEYLRTLGSDLNDNIHILWTGPKVVSKNITVDNIVEVGNLIYLFRNIYLLRYLCVCSFLPCSYKNKLKENL